VVLHPHITQAEELALGLNVNLVEGILQVLLTHTAPSLLVNELYMILVHYKIICWCIKLSRPIIQWLSSHISC